MSTRWFVCGARLYFAWSNLLNFNVNNQRPKCLKRGCARYIGPLLVLLLVLSVSACSDDFDASRESLLGTVKYQAETIVDSVGRSGLDPRVLEALRQVPRHAFVPSELQFLAYANRPLPIGGEQTISQPLIVAVMTHLLDIQPGDRIFELGTGSGYQAAVLAAMGADVYTVEIIPELARRASDTLKGLGYDRVRVRTGDGYQGWLEEAPFDGVIVTAAGERIPAPLIEQLSPGGRMVMPLGPEGGVQQLILLTKGADGGIERQDILPVRFVPITGAGSGRDDAR